MDWLLVLNVRYECNFNNTDISQQIVVVVVVVVTIEVGG